MKNAFALRSAAVLLILGLSGSGVSCMTTYDHAGRPVQSVDPGMAVAGVAAAGLIGYALADDTHSHHRPHYRRAYRCY